MKIIEITEDKFDKMTECAEKMLKYGGKLMSCLEEYDKYGERGHRMGYRDDDWDEPRYGNRNRYGRYN